jgi:hypothetical protein
MNGNYTEMTTMVESGLSVSVESSPKTPLTPRESVIISGDCGAPLKKRIQHVGDYAHLTVVGEGDRECQGESISPRVLFPEQQSNTGQVRRLLDFSTDTFSTVGFASTSELSPPPSWESTFNTIGSMPHNDDNNDDDDTVGDCSVCYASLPLRANHVFTSCGHLFCVKCLLTWWLTSPSCPMCRANILDQEPAADAAADADAADPSAYEEYHAINQPVLRNNIQNYYNVSSDSDSDSGLY